MKAETLILSFSVIIVLIISNTVESACIEPLPLTLEPVPPCTCCDMFGKRKKKCSFPEPQPEPQPHPTIHPFSSSTEIIETTGILMIKK